MLTMPLFGCRTLFLSASPPWPPLPLLFLFWSRKCLPAQAGLPPSGSGRDGEKVAEGAQKYLNDIFTVSFPDGACFFLGFFTDAVFNAFHCSGFTPFYQAKVIMLSRIMLLSPILMGLSNLFGTVTQLFRKFFIYSLSPIFYNAGIIIGVLFFYPFFGISGLALAWLLAL